MHLHTRSSGRLASAAVTAAALAALALAAASSSSAASIPACTSSGLVAWIDTSGNGAAGSFYYDLEFTNLSGHTCTLSGYPGVSGVDLAGHQLGSAASRNPTGRVRVITLASATNVNAPDSWATVVLRITDVGNYPTAMCRPVTAAGLRVYAPGQTTSSVVPFPFRACSRSGASYLSVEAVEKGTMSPQ